MSRLFGVDIAGIVAKNIGPGVHAATLSIKPIGGARDPQRLTAGRPAAPVIYQCRGFWEDYSPGQIGDQVLATDRKAVLIGDTIPAGADLKKGDEITIEGQTLMFWRWQSRDPAGAVLVAQCRDQRGPDGQ
jgi:hypothetical protein